MVNWVTFSHIWKKKSLILLVHTVSWFNDSNLLDYESWYKLKFSLIFMHHSWSSICVATCTPLCLTSRPPWYLCAGPAWSYYTEQVAEQHQERDLATECVIPPSAVCRRVFITCRGFPENGPRHNDAVSVGRASSLHPALSLRSFAPLVVVPPCVVRLCVLGVLGENKGFAGITPLRQTKGCSKLGVAPSDTWSARNLGAAQRAGEGTAFV